MARFRLTLMYILCRMNKIKYFDDDEDELEPYKKRKRGGSKKSAASRLLEEEDDDKEHTDDEDEDISSLVIHDDDEEDSGEEFSLKGSRRRKPARGKGSQSPRSLRSPADCKKARSEKRLANKNRQIKTKFERFRMLYLSSRFMISAAHTTFTCFSNLVTLFLNAVI